MHAHERISLLSRSDEDGPTDDYDCRGRRSECGSWLRLLVTELWTLLNASAPVIFAYILQNSLQTASILVVGRLGALELSVAAFSYMFATATAWLIGMGGTTAIDTLASASFTGSKDKHDVGILLQRAFIVLGLFYIPVILLWVFSEPVFKALGQEDALARDASRFLIALIPGGLGYIGFECVKKFLQAQGFMRPGTFVLLLTSPLNIGLNILFVHNLNFGLLGAPLATGISYWLSFALLVAYSYCFTDGECWGGFDRRCFHNIALFAKIALLGIIHVGTEWWAFEIVAIVAGQLGSLELATQSILMTADLVINMIPFGVGVATSYLVGNLLGSRNARGAAVSSYAGVCLSVILGTIICIVLLASKNVFGFLFNDDAQVAQMTSQVLPYVAVFQIADGLNGSCGGILRGQGKQHIGAAINFLSYYCLALPLGVYLAFHHWGLNGLWVSLCLSLYSVAVLELLLVVSSDWFKEVEKTFQRMED